jgi:hypothetical protein
MFDGAAAQMLHPDFAPQSRAHACAPVAHGGAVVQAARQRLRERAFSLGFAVTAASDLTIKAGVEKLPPAPESLPERMRFALAQPYREVELLSSAGVPAHTGADPEDRRRLGVAVTALRLLTATAAIDIPLNDPAHRGFHDPEGTLRWTNGAARIALPAFTGSATLEVHLQGQAARWTATGNPTAAWG